MYCTCIYIHIPLHTCRELQAYYSSKLGRPAGDIISYTMQQLGNMYPMCSPPYSNPALGHMNGTASLTSYPRLTSRTCNNQQMGHQTFLPSNARFLPNTLSSPLQPPLQSPTTLPSIFPGSPSITANGISQMVYASIFVHLQIFCGIGHSVLRNPQ